MRNAVAEEPIRFRAFGEIDPVGVLVGVNPSGFVIDEIGAGPLLLREREERKQFLRDRMNAVIGNSIAWKLGWRLQDIACGVEDARPRIVDRNQVPAGIAQPGEIANAPILQWE